MDKEAKTKLAEKPISWSEVYTDRTETLKDQYEDIVGPGSYFRFEGTDADSGDDYVVIVSPAKVKSPKAMFFAGVRKLPMDYPAGGLYFSEMRKAAEYAEDTWGVTMPPSMGYYDVEDLRGIGRKVKKWREENKAETADKKEAIIDEKEAAVQDSNVMEKQAVDLRRLRTGYVWYNLDDIMMGRNPDFTTAVITQPSLETAKDVALEERALRRGQIAKVYGAENTEEDFYQIWMSYKPDEGIFIVVVSPYLTKFYDEAKDKFSVFWRKLNVTPQSEIDAKVSEIIQEYARQYGIALTEDDIQNTGNPFFGELSLKPDAKKRVYESEEWKQKIFDYYGIAPGKGSITRLREAYKTKLADWKRLKAAYEARQESGEAFELQQPPPPRVDLAKRARGQQRFTTVHKEPVPPGMSTEEAVARFGFDSMHDAIEHLNATAWPGAPISTSDVKNTTSEDLKRARLANESGRPISLAVPKADEDFDVVATPRTSPVGERATHSPVPKPRTKTPAKEKKLDKPLEKKPEHVINDDFVIPEGMFDDDEVSASAVNSTLERLIKLAEFLDNSGQYNDSEEIHKILRKHLPPRKG